MDVSPADPSLPAIGASLRARRKALKVSAGSAAETAGISRVTLHRIERGEPTVNVGAVAAVASALGLRLVVVGKAEGAAPETSPAVRVGDHEQLKRIAWQLDPTTIVSPREALSLYERGWRHVDVGALTDTERMFIRSLTTLGVTPLV